MYNHCANNPLTQKGARLLSAKAHLAKRVSAVASHCADHSLSTKEGLHSQFARCRSLGAGERQPTGTGFSNDTGFYVQQV